MDTKVKCLPVYILIDTSQSMTQYEDVLNNSIESLYDTLLQARGFLTSPSYA